MAGRNLARVRRVDRSIAIGHRVDRCQCHLSRILFGLVGRTNQGDRSVRIFCSEPERLNTAARYRSYWADRHAHRLRLGMGVRLSSIG